MPTKDPAAGLRGVRGVDDMTDALDKLGDRGGTSAMEGTGTTRMRTRCGEERRGEDKKGRTNHHAPKVTRFLVVGACKQIN